VGDSAKLGQTLSRVLRNARQMSLLVGTKLDGCHTRSHEIKRKKTRVKVRTIYDVSQIVSTLRAFSNCVVLDDRCFENNMVYIQNTPFSLHQSLQCFDVFGT
jgi:hypothetical protein